MFTCKIKTGNDAFSDGNKAYEVARILRELAEAIETGFTGSLGLRDANGNTVGEARLT